MRPRMYYDGKVTVSVCPTTGPMFFPGEGTPVRSQVLPGGGVYPGQGTPPDGTGVTPPPPPGTGQAVASRRRTFLF